MKVLNRQSGVTLNELIITFSVVAILLGLGASTYSQFVSKRKVAGAADLVTTFFENVKLQSIKRNQFATITYKHAADGAAWCLGAVMGKDVSCDCLAETPQCLIDAVPTVLSNETYAEFADVNTIFDEGTVSFDPVRGILTDPEAAVSMEIKHLSEDFRVNISVNATGSIRKCSPPGYELVGYATCT